MSFFIVLLCFSILFYGLQQYTKGKKVNGLLVYFFFVSEACGVIPASLLSPFPLSKFTDFAILYLVYVIYRKINQRRIWDFGSPIFKYILLLFIYISIIFIVTIVTKTELFTYSFRIYRFYFLFLSFYLVQDLNRQELQVLLRKIAIITTCFVIIHCLQPFLGIKLLHHAGTGKDEVLSLTSRFRNIPYLAYFFIIYLFINLRLTNIKLIIYTVVFSFSLVLTQHRAIMLSLFVVIVLYYLYNRNYFRFFQTLIMGCVISLLLGDMIMNRFENKDTGTNTFNDIENVFNLDFKTVKSESYSSEDGSLVFRLWVLIERIQYLIDNPKYFLTGVGIRNEESPLTRKDFNFSLGTFRTVGDELVIGQVGSADLQWVNPIFQLGFIGLSMYLVVMYQIIYFLYKNKTQSKIAFAAFLYYLFLILISFKNDHLFGELQLFFIYIFIVLINKNKELGESQDESFNFNLFKGIK